MQTLIPSKQKRLYKILQDKLILVSQSDKFVSSIDKWTAHKNEYIRDPTSLPHRAFSIFLFDPNSRLLLQRRAKVKKTFPLRWTNSCCSHPNMIQFTDGVIDIEPMKDALYRALQRQLMINMTGEEFRFVKKVLYKEEGSAEEQYGEYEMDHIFLCRISDPKAAKPVASEIHQAEWVQHHRLKEFIRQKTLEGCLFTPWFNKINDSGLLDEWWRMVENNQLCSLPAGSIHSLLH